MSSTSAIPSKEALEYAQSVIRRRKTLALQELLTGAHIDHVATLVFSYVGDDEDDARSAGAVADEILRYLAQHLGPLVERSDAVMTHEDVTR